MMLKSVDFPLMFRKCVYGDNKKMGASIRLQWRKKETNRKTLS